MKRFKANPNAAFVRALLAAAKTLAGTRPALDATGKALDRAAYMAWLGECAALARTEARNGK